VAEEMACEVGCELVEISQENSCPQVDLDNYETVIVDTNIRGGEPNKALAAFLESKTFKEKKKKFALFLTWCGGGQSNRLAFERIKKILNSKDQKIIEDYFCCFGKFGILRRGHPNRQDCEDARKWAMKITS
jgi:menaquinone-dependent protoporphyrinogen IX oxidase